MRITYFAPCFFLALTACPPDEEVKISSPSPKAESQKYKAFGNEPGWTLEIDEQQISYTGDYGETVITVPTPPKRQSLAVKRYLTPQINVIIMDKPCSDTMADRRFGNSVVLEIGAQTLRGCGGKILPPDDMEDTYWTAVSDSSSASGAELRFQRGQITGNAGCNGMNAAYRYVDGKLTVSRIMTSKKLCGGAADAYEKRLLNILSGEADVNFLPNGNMTLSHETDSLEFKRQL